uniref:TIR domain-containing protein n=1 Tax=Hucho hucho TaxID=62062 RepID=A0A4W5N0M3_9TELE
MEADEKQHLIPPLLPTLSIPPALPKLREGESYHVFISYSSTDLRWAHSLVNSLESNGLKVCYHERDFVPGRTVLENMSDCIQESQKVLLVLSPDFVRSRWCLLEANMSLFRYCLEQKPVVPVLLEPGVPVPLHLCHLTYLEARDPDFLSKVLKVLCTPNQQLRGTSVVPFQPPSIYNGKALQPLCAVNEEGLQKYEAGQFSEMEVPDQLRLVIEDQEKYSRAIRMVNSVSQTKVWLRPLWLRILIYFVFTIIFLFLTVFLVYFSVVQSIVPTEFMPGSVVFFGAPLGLVIQLCLWHKDNERYIRREMQKAVGHANLLLSGEKVWMGCLSNAKLYVVYVSIDSCRKEFCDTFHEQACAEEMFQRAVLFFSSGYTCCLSKRHFPFPQPSSKGHLEGGVCFCQYVSQQLSRGEWL